MIWQCQWDAEAQRWEQANEIPNSQGGEFVNTLYVNDLWRNTKEDSNGNIISTTEPGIVLAYRAGEGTGSEIYAVFGAWNGQGELEWSDPTQLTNDIEEDKEFSLVEGVSGEFSLVVQKQFAGKNPEDEFDLDLTDVSNLTDDGNLPLELAIPQRPDTDLFQSTFKVESNSLSGYNTNTNQWQPLSQVPTQPAEREPATPNNALRTGVYTELNRSDLTPYTQINNSPTALLGIGNSATIALGGGGETTNGWSKKTWNTRSKSNDRGQNRKNSFRYLTVYPETFKFVIRNRKAMLPGESRKYGWQIEAAGSYGVNPYSASTAETSSKLNFTYGKRGASSNFEETQKAIKAKEEQELKGEIAAGGELKTKYIFDGDAQGLTSPLDKYYNLPNISVSGILKKQWGKKDEWHTNFQLSVGVGVNFANIYGSKAFFESELETRDINPNILSNYSLEELTHVGDAGHAIVLLNDLFFSAKTIAAYFLWREKIEPDAEKPENVIGEIVTIGFPAINELFLASSPDNVITDATGFIENIAAKLSLKNKYDFGIEGTWASTTIQDRLLKSSGILGVLIKDNDLDLPESTKLNYKLRKEKISAGIALPLNNYLALVNYQFKSVSSNAKNELEGLIPQRPQPPEPPVGPDKPYAGNDNPSQIEQSQQPSVSVSLQIAPTSGPDVPFTYNPNLANNASYTVATSSGNSETIPATMLDTTTSVLKAYTFTNGSVDLSDLQTSLGKNLNDTSEPIKVEIKGIPIFGYENAEAEVEIQDGAITSLRITKSSKYSYLPVDVNSDKIYLSLNLAKAGLVNAQSIEPLIYINDNGINSPVKTDEIYRINSSKIIINTIPSLNQEYPVYNSEYTAETFSKPDPRHNLNYSYHDVPFTLTANDDGIAINLLKNESRAKVNFNSAGSIVSIEPNADILFTTGASRAGSSGTNVDPDLNNLQINLEFNIFTSENNFPVTLQDVSIPLSESLAQATSYNNVVSEDSFSRVVGAANVGVFLSDSSNNVDILTPSNGNQVVSNRVNYYATDSYGNATTIALNARNGKFYETKYFKNNTAESNLLFANQRTFSAASSPTASLLFSASGADSSEATENQPNLIGATVVAWVERTEDIIPYSSLSENGEENLRNFLDKYYKNQQINFRVKPANSDTFLEVSQAQLNALYTPDDAIIRDLRLFVVDGSSPDSKQQTLLVWSEIPLPDATSQVATLNAAFLNANIDPDNITWDALTTNSEGQSTISQIPWASELEALAISDITAASLDSVYSNSLVTTVPVIAFSREVKTPYRQSVLEDSPDIYLQFNELTAGLSPINIGVDNSANTQTFASSTGLDFTVDSALSQSSAYTVGNTDGTGLLISGLNSYNKLAINSLDSITEEQLVTSYKNLSASFTGSANIDTQRTDTSILTVENLTGTLQVGDIITGAGLLPNTRVIEVITAYGAETTQEPTGTYRLNGAQTVTSTDLQSYPYTPLLANDKLSLYISGTTLTTLGDSLLDVGDQILGNGITDGTSVTEILSPTTYQINKEQTVGSSENPVAALGISGDLQSITESSVNAPYSIEFWYKPKDDQQVPPDGSGIVAFGQPSSDAINSELPNGWLLASSLIVEKISYQEAAELGNTDAFNAINDTNNPVSPSETFYWTWALVAEGANSWALEGTEGYNPGGSNLFENGILLNNLRAGNSIEGVYEFLKNNQIPDEDISNILGFTGLPIDTIAQVPSTNLEFSRFIDTEQNAPTSELNSIDIDTSSSVLNTGIIRSSDIQNSLENLFEKMYNQQKKTSKPYVAFSTDPSSNPSTNSDPQEYGGYELTFDYSYGVAMSVRQDQENGPIELLFDASGGQPVVANLSEFTPNENGWYYVVATYQPSDENLDQLLSSIKTGTASIYIQNTLAASTTVQNAYSLDSVIDAIQLLGNNPGAAIDQFAIYSKALTPEPTLDKPADWDFFDPENIQKLIFEMQLATDTGDDDSVTIPGAITKHYDAINVNPNDAEVNTFYTTFLPSSDDPLIGEWSTPTALNPVLTVQETLPSAAQPASLQDSFVLSFSLDGLIQKLESDRASNNREAGNISVKSTDWTLSSISFTTEKDSAIAYYFNPEQILVGNEPISLLQPNSKTSNLSYTFMSLSTAVNLVIPKEYVANENVASFDISFSNGETYSHKVYLPDLKEGIINYTNDIYESQSNNSVLQTRNQAIATAAVLEQAPLQLKYVDSGEVIRAESDNAITGSNSEQKFATSTTAGYWLNGSTHNGWLAIAQPQSPNATSNPAGRIWIQYTGQYDQTTGLGVKSVDSAPTTWLNALADSSFSPDKPNYPLLQSNGLQYGGLLITADPTEGWGQDFGVNMITADLTGNQIDDLIIAAPNANDGGVVYVINGEWISSNLASSTDGQTILNLSNPTEFNTSESVVVRVLKPSNYQTPSNQDSTTSSFGSSLAWNPLDKILYVGAPTFLEDPEPSEALPDIYEAQQVGAVYQYSNPQSFFEPGSLTPTVQTGIQGVSKIASPVGLPEYRQWGSRYGSSLAYKIGATKDNGELAVGAPGYTAGLLYAGSEEAQQIFQEGKLRTNDSNDGSLAGYILPSGDDSIDLYKGINSDFVSLANQDDQYFSNLRNLQTDNVVQATIYNNMSAQLSEIGAVYLYNDGLKSPSQASNVIHGPQPWNVVGNSGFGNSLAYVDLTNSKNPDLAIGADSSGGPGAVYVFSDLQKSIGHHFAFEHADLTLYGAESLDKFGGGLTALGDVNGDKYDDLLIQASYANSRAGAGYVLFGSDQFKPKEQITGNVAEGLIGLFTKADGSTFYSSVLEELGYGQGLTGIGSFGLGDINGDGINDIQLGSGANGSSYLTWGKPYLEAINNLALNKLTSNNGYMLDGLATKARGSLRSIGDFNGDGYDDFVSVQEGDYLNTVRIELGADTQAVLADYLYNFYGFSISSDTEIVPAGDVNGDGLADVALLINENLSPSDDGNQGAGSTIGILYGRSSDQLPIGSNFGFLSPVMANSSDPLRALPTQQISGGLSSASPAIVVDEKTLYAAVQGINSSSIWFATSNDAGSTWEPWIDLSESNPNFLTQAGPSLVIFEGKLFLSYLDLEGYLQISSLDQGSQSLSDWSTPVAILDENGDPFASNYAPQLISEGDVLSIFWVDKSDGTIYSSFSTTPSQGVTTNEPSIWEGINSGSSPATPALAQLGDTIYMAVQGNSDESIYWSSSVDGGTTWSQWLTVSGATTSHAPSLAVYNDTLYVAYLGEDTSIYVAQFDADNQQWGASVDTGHASSQAPALVTELVDGGEQLAFYYVSNSSDCYIQKAWSTDPSSSNPWGNWFELPYNGGTQTASSSLSVTTIGDQTVVAYQGGTTAAPSDTIYISSSASPNTNSVESWQAQAYTNPNQRTSIGLSGNDNTIVISYTDSTTPSDLQLQRLSNRAGKWYTIGASNVKRDELSATSVSLLQLDSTDQSPSGILFAGIETNNANLIQASFAPTESEYSWTKATQLQIDGNNPILATAAPSGTTLLDVPFIAVNDNGTINVYGPDESGSNLTLATSFSAGNNSGINTASSPGLTTTETGLALTYTNQDNSINLERIDFLSIAGELEDGVVLLDGGFDTSKADLAWITTTLSGTQGGISTELGSTPVMVDGNLLLSSIDATSNAVHLSAIPVLSDPDSTTWINSTIQLPDYNGGWLISQTNPNSISTLAAVGDLNGDGLDDLIVANNSVSTPILDVPEDWDALGNGASSVASPALALLGDTLYMAVQSNSGGRNIYWSFSTDNGDSWAGFQSLPSSMTTNKPPSIAAFDGTLYLSYLGDGNDEINITSLTDSATNTWSDVYQVPYFSDNKNEIQSAEYATLVKETVDGTDNLAIYYTATNGSSDILRTATTNPTSASGWNGIITNLNYSQSSSDNQTASGPLAVSSVDGQTVIAYQGGVIGNAASEIYIATSTSQANGTSWSAQSVIPLNTTTDQTINISLAQMRSTDLLLSYSNSLSADELQLQRFSLLSSGSVQMSGTATTTNLPDSGSTIVSMLATNANNTDSLLFAGINNLNNNSIEVKSASPTTEQPGLRLINGAPSTGQFVALNNPFASEQSVQLAPVLSSNDSVTTVNAAINGQGTIQLTAANNSDLSSIESSAYAPRNFVAHGSLSSAQLLFPSNTSWSSTSTPPLTGAPSLNTALSFGDLNGDGYNDYFDADASLWIASAPEAPVFSLWSIRAAGDVNGNGVDDVLLALTPQGPSYQPQADGTPSAIYSALIDGALFNVDTSSNTFNLGDLKAALNPYNKTELFDVTTMSYSDEYQSLQNWFSPILKYQAPVSIDSVSTEISASVSSQNTTPPVFLHSKSGGLYAIVSNVEQSTLGNSISIYTSPSLDPNDLIETAQIDLSTLKSPDGSSTLFPTNRIAPLTPGAAIHEGKLFVAIPQSTEPSKSFGRATNDIWIAYADLKDISDQDKWVTYKVRTGSDISDFSAEYSLLSPTLISEGERLALYFPSGDAGNNDTSLNIHYLYSTDPAKSETWGATYKPNSNSYSDQSQTINIDASLSTTPSSKGWASSSGVIVTSPISATTFQGRTVLAFRGYGDGAGDNVANGNLLLAFAPSAVSLSSTTNSDWTLWDTTVSGINTPSITTDQANLYVTYTPWSTSSTSAFFFPVAINVENNNPGEPLDLGSSEQIKSGTTHTLPITLIETGNDGLTSKDYAGGYFLNADVEANNVGNAPNSVTPSFFDGNLFVTNQVGSSASVSIDYLVGEATFSGQTNTQGLSLAGYSLDGNLDVNGDGFTDILLSDPSDPSLSVDNQYVLFGGDFLDIASQVGTTANDTLVGTPLADVIYTISGDDTVVSNGGPDVIYTGSGADTISINGNSFLRIDAGSGIDKLLLEGDAYQAYDFRLDIDTPAYFAGTKLRNIEIISSVDYDSNTLSFDPAAVAAMNDDRMLFVVPDESDIINLYGNADQQFFRNTNFDTNFGGVVWNAFAATTLGSSALSQSPSLVYVLNPSPDDESWLTSNINTTPAEGASSSLTATALFEQPADPLLPVPSVVRQSIPFGNGLTLTAYKSRSTDSVARFELTRASSDAVQVIAYASSSANSTAEPGRHYTAIAGLVRFEPGETRKLITVPLNSVAFAQLRNAELSLQVEELPNHNQQPIHLLIDPHTSKAGNDSLPPTLSSFQLDPSPQSLSALLTFRADVNTKQTAFDSLKLTVSERPTANADTALSTTTLSIAEFMESDVLEPVADQLTEALHLDNDAQTNAQVSARFQLNLDSSSSQPRLELLGPDLETLSPFVRTSSNTFSLQKDSPLTVWRSDSSSGSLQLSLLAADGTELNLLSNALSSQSGAISSASISGDSWIATEDKAIGSRAAIPSASISQQDLSFSASLDGQPLELLDFVISGNELTASFADGITAHLNLGSTPTTPTQQPIIPTVTVNRLGYFNNHLAFYAVDDLTGTVDGLAPSDPGYLDAALARAKTSNLYLDADQLPGYAQSASFSDLEINPNRQYGLLCVVKGDTDTIYSSFSAANPNEAVQMIAIDTAQTPSVTTIAIEDAPFNPNNPSSSDYNDLIVQINHVSSFPIL